MTLYRNKFRVESARLHDYDYRHPGYYFVTICARNRSCFFGDIFENHMNLSKCGQLAFQYWVDIPQHFSMVELDEFVVMPNHVHGIIRILDSNGDNARFPYPFISRFAMIEIPDIPNIPGIPDIPNIPGIPGIPNIPDIPNISVETLHCNVSTGLTGLTGSTGSTGLTGSTGSTGLTGYTGLDTISGPSMDVHFDNNPDFPDYDFILHNSNNFQDFISGKNQFMSDISPKPGSLAAIMRSYKSVVSRECHIFCPEFNWHPRFHDRIIRNCTELVNVRNYIQRNPAKWKNSIFFI